MNRHSVGIELCNMGYLDSDYKTYVKSKCQEEQVVALDEAFKGKLYWHDQYRYIENL